MHIDKETVAAYDAYPHVVDERFRLHMRRHDLPHADAFLEAVPGGRILDIGAGPGHFGRYFASKGCETLCVEPSAAMRALCHANGLETVEAGALDFELSMRFDGIWANASLLHLPKAVIPDALERIERHLVPHGILGCSVKEGMGERYETHESMPGTRRWFSYFSDDLFRELLLPRFELIRFERSRASARTTFLKYVVRARRGA